LSTTPSSAGSGAEGGLHLRLALDHRGDDLERAGEIDRAVLDREHHRLMRRNRESSRGGVVFDEPVRRLGKGPLADVPLRQPAGPLRQLVGRRRPTLVQSVEQAKPQTNANRWHTERAAKIAKHLADELMEFGFIELRHKDSPELIALDLYLA
jgi:hypothetical protein